MKWGEVEQISEKISYNSLIGLFDWYVFFTRRNLLPRVQSQDLGSNFVNSICLSMHTEKAGIRGLPFAHTFGINHIA